jgi:hypothetical protein
LDFLFGIAFLVTSFACCSSGPAASRISIVAAARVSAGVTPRSRLPMISIRINRIDCPAFAMKRPT